MSRRRGHNAAASSNKTAPITTKLPTTTLQPVSNVRHPAFGILLVLFFAVPLAILSDDWLPLPLPASIPPSHFSEERAMEHLNTIVNFGIRTVGSHANENLTPEYIVQFVTQVRNEAPQGVDVAVEIQKPSGSFTSWFLGGFTNVYSKVTNVLVRVSFTGARTKQNALLVSAHFDTALGTVAASDDAANIAAMLEIVRNVVHGEKLPHSIIFIFNGAEETNWQAAHGFITQHPWAKHVRSVINLEGSGAGGRAMVVQTGPRHSWLVQEFKRVAPLPHASTMAQEIFQTKIIPGWTDFETYVEFSDHEISGIDMVFIRDGYVYHTDIDDYQHVTKGTLQHLGNNLLPTVRALASSPYLVDAVHYKDKTAIFFDLAGILLIVFPDKDVARVWYIGLLISALIEHLFASQRKKKNKKSSVVMLTVTREWFELWFRQMLVLLCGIVCSLLVGFLFKVIRCDMSWFSSMYLTWLLYGASSLAGVCWGRRWFLSSSRYDTSAASTTMWWSLLLLLTWFNVQSAYVPAMVLFFQVLGSILSTRQLVPKMAIDLIIHFLPCVLLTQYYCTVGTFFVPITGRIGDWIPSDILVAALLGVVGSLVWITPTMSLEQDNSRTPSFSHACTLSLSHCIWCSTGMTTLLFLYLSIQTPYTRETPKRLYIQQTSRTVFDVALEPNQPPAVLTHDQGLWVNGFDERGLNPDVVALNIPELTKNKKKIMCEKDKVYCGFPWYFPIQEMVLHQWYVPIDETNLLEDPFVHGNGKMNEKEKFQLTLISKLKLNNGGSRLEFVGIGPSHMTAVIEGKVNRWSFTEDRIPYKSSQSCIDAMDRDHDCRFVFYSTGTLGISEWSFWLETPAPPPPSGGGGGGEEVGVKIAFYGHYGLDVMTEGEMLTSVRQQLPEWMTMVSWISHWHQYEY